MPLAGETFGDRLRRLREAAGFSIKTLAEEAGVTEGAIRQLETGGVQNPSFAVGLRIATAVKADPYELAFGGAGTGSVAERLAKIEARLARLEGRGK